MAVKEVKLCLLGESGVGKSSIVQRFVTDQFRPAMESTIGASFMTKTIELNGKIYKFQIWDTAGQEKYRALAPMYYRGAAAAIVVYDITRESSFATLKSWISELRKYGPSNIVVAIAGNKSDMEDLREVQLKEASRYAEESGSFCVETSAKTAINIAALFVEIARRLPVDDIEPEMARNRTGNVNLRDFDSDKKRKCCAS